ncbi:MAG: lipopolysaccharide core heptose(II) kinase RfaY [Enterobacteriaceae bacterium]
MSHLIKESCSDGFLVYQKNDGTNYLTILEDFKAGKIAWQALNSGNPQRDVFLIEVDGKKYILKWDRELDPRLEKRLWQFISGPYYSGLIQRVAAAKQEGCNIIGDIYLVAERSRWRQSIEAYVLAEYLPGEPLGSLPPEQIQHYKPTIANTVQTLHRYQLASNDLHAGNFIITPQGLKLIDLSDRGALAICQANDLLALRRLYQIELPPSGWVYHLIAGKEKLKRFSRRLRGKLH